MKLALNLAMASLLVFSYSAQSSQFNNWILAYHHDASGNQIAGSEQDLIDAIVNGASLKVALVSANGDTQVELETYGVNTAVSPVVVWGIAERASYTRNGSGRIVFVPGIIARDIFQSDGTRINESYSYAGASQGGFSQNREMKWYISK